MASGDIKGFYRQRKKGGVTKPSPSAKRKTSPPTKATARGRGGATLSRPDSAQPAALVSHGAFDLKEDYSADEETLRQFDMDMRYGPCLGMTRMERWERASGMGLNPPAELEHILRSGAGGGGGKVDLECLWEGRV